ncbi:hypothetical protein C7H19_08315 [Aphanothece hegewaldii CCALA 016]|uniref:Uncharacterized protein n=1 Tax=Aphanothece hegewaldii CCALA 016 TaxID=2107694 RepID=A0A2T1LZY1_9CHRO|nr:HEAT repeat domain-containing protein [Aphanothece hegewaldii]PSF37968.1 hypothetical protein C7H19_08315 [Aphanothece hegewaldii CCALA 016]
MMRYRFSILLILWVSCLGLSLSSQSPTGVKGLLSDVANAQTEANSNPTPDPSGTTDSQAKYNRLMDEGYNAFNRKEYKKALQNFQQALALRPNDLAATNAIKSVESLANSNSSLPLNPTADPPQNTAPRVQKTSPIPLYLGAGLLTLAAAGALLSLASKFRSSLPNIKIPTTDRYYDRNKKRKRPSPPESNPSDNGTFNVNHASQTDNNSFNFSRFDEDVNFEDTTSIIQTPSRIPNADLILQLIGELGDPEPRTRRRAIWKLAQMSDSRSMQPLVNVMADADSYERSLILEALSQICTRTLRPLNQALAISLSDKNPQVRKNAIRDLTRIYDIMSQITQTICHALDDSDEEVQETAKWAMKQLNIPLPPKLDFTSVEVEQNEGGFDSDNIEEASYTEEVKEAKKD